MKRIPYLVCACLLFTLFFSCKRDFDFPEGITLRNDSIYLDKIYDLDRDSGDTLMVWSFTYDVHKRVTTMEIVTDSNNHLNYYYYYNGTDTLPYKHMVLQQAYVGYFVYDTQMVYHSYDNQQRNLKDSSFEIFEYGTTDTIIKTAGYSYAPGKKWGTGTEDYPNLANQFRSYNDTATLDGNNNIISGSTYVDYFNSNKELFRTATYTYDQHPNPFSLLSNFKAHQLMPTNRSWDWTYQPFNNVLTYDEISYGYTTSKNFVYTYKPNGLPATRIETILTGEKYIYTYRALP